MMDQWLENTPEMRAKHMKENGAAWIAMNWGGISIAFYRLASAGEWTNYDCWEDFDGEVTHFMPLEEPKHPGAGGE